MRLPLVLLACSLLGVIGGAFLIGMWAVGCAVIFDSLALGAWALWGYDDGEPPQPPQPVESLAQPQVLTVDDILDRARYAP